MVLITIESPVDEIRLHSRVIAGLRFAQFYIPVFFRYIKAAVLSGFFYTRNSLPHACGEIAYGDQDSDVYHGTSPRLWGDSHCQPCGSLHIRYIPTSVGRLTSCLTPVTNSAVHPHACGEICPLALALIDRGGTSPRLWGDSTIQPIRRRDHRYIPTLVGRLNWIRSFLATGRVHPHACGEISSRWLSILICSGTSPRLWGD